MSLLRVAIRLIFSVNIRVHHTSRWTRVVWGGLPGPIQQFHPTQFLKHNTTPILGRTYRPQPSLAFAPILITENARLAQTIATQTVRAKQPREIFVDCADRLPVYYRCPN